jgi:hypothetical protein
MRSIAFELPRPFKKESVVSLISIKAHRLAPSDL